MINRIINKNTAKTTASKTTTKRTKTTIMGCTCTRRERREQEPLIIQPKPLSSPISWRKWGCRKCPATYDKLWQVTGHVAEHGPPLSVTYDRYIVNILLTNIAFMEWNRNRTH